MTIEDFQQICKKLPGVTEDIKWENHLCFCVCEKMFLVTSPDSTPVTASFKTSDDEFENLSEKAGFKPAPYMARNKWIYVDDIGRMSKKQWEKYVKEAHSLIASKLTVRLQKQLGILK